MSPDNFAEWTSLLPPLIAIGLALWLRAVIPAIFLGIWVGMILENGGGIAGVFTALLETFQVHGIVNLVMGWANSVRRGQLSVWFLGLCIFFDDYTNTLVVGNTVRPVTDRLRVSREKLAYLVDSTAAPVACIAVLTTWIGYELGLISKAIEGLPGFDVHSRSAGHRLALTASAGHPHLSSAL